MEKSETIKELAAALAKAQSEIAGAKKDSSNPFFKSSYADLESVWSACREPLTKNGLSVSQLLGSGEDGIYLTTILLHSSGEFISDRVKIPVAKPNDPQALGSATSYARRYALAALVGIYQTDDDGESAMNRGLQAGANTSYTIPVGKHQGKKLTDLTEAELIAMSDYLEEHKAQLDNKTKDLLFRINSHLKK